MKKTTFIPARIFLILAMTLATISTSAQTDAIGNVLAGVWQREPEQGNSSNRGYTEIQVMKADGTFAWAGVVLLKNGRCTVVPYSYGSYSFLRGAYTENGRKAAIEIMGRDKMRITRKEQQQTWLRRKDMPKKVTDYIVERCRDEFVVPTEVLEMCDKYIFNK